MSELIIPASAELVEIERFIHEVASDARHPINDRRHPQHRECLMAWHDLMETADSLRQPYSIN